MRFSEEVIRIVKEVPRGAVVSYGQVAAYVGVPRAARQVGWTLRNMGEGEIPWWRVVNNSGRISIKGNMFNDAIQQRKLLGAEGVEVGEDFTLDMKKYRFLPEVEQLKSWGLKDEYLHMILNRFRVGY